MQSGMLMTAQRTQQSEDSRRAATVSASLSSMVADGSNRVKGGAKIILDEIEQLFEEYVPPPKVGCEAYFEHNAAQGLVNGMILVNALQMGIAVDVQGPGWDEVWSASEQFFAAFFGVEMVVKVATLRLTYFGSSCREPDLWNFFDFGIAWSSLFDAFSPAIWPPEEGEDVGGTSLIGLLRLLRLLRMMKIMRVVPQFRILFEGILKALHSMFWVSALCTFILYMVAVACVVLMGGQDAGYASWSDNKEDLQSTAESEFNNYEYFGTVSRSMVSLYGFVVMAELDSIVRPVWERQPVVALGLLLLSFVLMFGVMNILVGMIMDNVMQTVRDMDTEALRKQQKQQAMFTKELSDAIFEIDTDGSGSIAISELKGTHNDHFMRLVKGLDLPHRFTLENLFTMVDQNAEGDVKRDDFHDGMFRIFLNNDFQRDCMMQLRISTLRQEVRAIHEDVKSGMTDMRDNFARQLGDTSQPREQFRSASGECKGLSTDTARLSSVTRPQAMPPTKDSDSERTPTTKDPDSECVPETSHNVCRVPARREEPAEAPLARGLEVVFAHMSRCVEQLQRENQQERMLAEQKRATEEGQELQVEARLAGAWHDWLRASETMGRVMEDQYSTRPRAEHSPDARLMAPELSQEGPETDVTIQNRCWTEALAEEVFRV